MSDAKPAVEAVKSDPAEVTQAEETVDLAPDAKAEAPAEVALNDTADDAKPAESKDSADVPEATKTEESSADKSEAKANGEKKATSGDADKNDKQERVGSRYKGRGPNKYDRGGIRKNNDYYRRANTNEFADLPETDDPVEIRNQVEFYLSSHNLRTDRHLFLEMDGPENRPVFIKHICTFKRMHRFQPYSAVVNALRDSEDLIVLDDGEYSGIGNEAVQRKEPIAVPKKDSDDRFPPTAEELFDRLFKSAVNNLDASVYVKGFGEQEQAGNIALEGFFKPYGAVMVRKRRDEDGSWKGSVFVEFDSVETQQQFLDLDPKPKYNGNELTIMAKKEYSEMKCKEKGITPAWMRKDEHNNSRSHGYSRGGRGNRGARGGRTRGGGRYTDRSNGRDHRDRRNRDRSRSRSPRRRRDRSDSHSTDEGKSWKDRRENFQKFGDHNKKTKHGAERDAFGVPIVRDTRTEEEKARSKANKRKADDSDRDDGPKKPKVEAQTAGNKRKADDSDREDAPKKSKVEAKIEIKEDA